MSDVPIFVSTPSKLNDRQKAVFDTISQAMDEARLHPCTVRSNLPLKSPLEDVHKLAQRCAGGMVLGFRQAATEKMTRWAGSAFERRDRATTYHPSPWNQLEAGILYSLGLPMLVLAEEGISGGIFDSSAAGHVVHAFTADGFDATEAERIRRLILDWSRDVVDIRMEVNSRRG